MYVTVSNTVTNQFRYSVCLFNVVVVEGEMGMGKNNQVVDVYKEGSQTNWGNVIIWLSLAFFLIQLIGIFLAYYLFDDGEMSGKDAARTAFFIAASVDAVLLIVGVAIGIYHLASRNMAGAIREHDRTDAEGDAEKLAVLLNGTAAITSANGNAAKVGAAADANALKWTALTMREAQRIADERRRDGPADDDFLDKLLGPEPTLLETGKDEWK